MIPISKQCELLGLCRSSYYYRSHKNDSYNLMLMNLIDEQYTRIPFYGVPRITAWPRRQGHLVNPKRVRHLMRLMGLKAIYPKPRLSQSCLEYKRYPYLLKGVTINHPNQVWCTDITYIRLMVRFSHEAIRKIVDISHAIFIKSDFLFLEFKRPFRCQNNLLFTLVCA